MIANCSPKIIGSKLGSPFGLRPRSGLGSGSARARNYSALFGLGSAQGSARASRLTKLAARLGIRSISARSGSDRVSGSALFRVGLARRSARLGSVLPSIRYLLFGWKLNSINPDQVINLAWDSAQLSSEFGSVQIEAQFVWVDSVLGSGSALQLEAELVLARSLARRSLMAWSLVRLGLGSRLGTLLSFIRSLDRYLSSRIGAVFDSELSSA